MYLSEGRLFSGLFCDYKENALFENRIEMSQIMSGIMEKKNSIQRKPTLARRVSDMFKGK